MKQWVSQIRSITAWATLVAALNSLVVFSILRSKYPWLGTSDQQFGPQPPAWLSWWQPVSFVLLIGLAIVSLKSRNRCSGLVDNDSIPKRS
jgi:hypothetical protein